MKNTYGKEYTKKLDKSLFGCQKQKKLFDAYFAKKDVKKMFYWFAQRFDVMRRQKMSSFSYQNARYLVKIHRFDWAQATK